MNEIEGEQLTGYSDHEKILNKMFQMFPDVEIVLTLGEEGAIYADGENIYFQPVFKVDAIDTTAAGDTFTGYFLAGVMDGKSIKDVLKISAKASSIAVTRKGAVRSIPEKKEVMESLDM